MPKLTPEQRSGVQMLSFLIAVAVGITILTMLGCPAYKLYTSSIDRSIQRDQMQVNHERIIDEAVATMEAAPYLQKADSIRHIQIFRAEK